MIRSLIPPVIAALALVGIAGPGCLAAAAAPQPETEYKSAAGGKKGNQFVTEAEAATRGGGTYEAGGTAGGPATEKYFRAEQRTCEIARGLDEPQSDLTSRCEEWENLVTEDLECDPDSYYLGALYRQTREIGDDGVPGEWSAAGAPVADHSCVTPADLADEAERALAALTITPSPLTVQPDRGWTLVNIPTITYTEPGEQMLDTTLLGIPVQLRALPDTYTWNYGDGSDPLVTTDPGAPYPNETVAHTYDQPADAVTISLTTTWAGQFRITGTPTWTTIPGTATTTTTADPLQVREARARLVSEACSSPAYRGWTTEQLREVGCA